MSGFIRHPNVFLGDGAEIGHYVLLGEPPRDTAPGELETHIGVGAVIRSHTVIYAGNRIGQRFQTGHGVLVRELNDIGDDVSIGSHTVVEHHVAMGDGVRIHSQAFIPEYSVLEAGCWIGPNAVFTNTRYPLSAGVKEALKGPTVCRGAKVGAHATLLPGVVIGEGALVGAGSVVTHDVAAGLVVAGNPARVIGAVAYLPAYQQAERLERP